MEPVEINAGAWYLRALRADDRVDDRPALAELGETDAHYVTRPRRRLGVRRRVLVGSLRPDDGRAARCREFRAAVRRSSAGSARPRQIESFGGKLKSTCDLRWSRLSRAGLRADEKKLRT